MAHVPSPVSQFLLVAAFVAVASSAGLQWLGLSAQAEAARQLASRQSLAEFSGILARYEAATARDKPQAAVELAGAAERLSREAKGEGLASASRRVVALTSYENAAQAREIELQERLRAEVRGLLNETESLELAAIGRAVWLSSINQVLLVGTAILCGLLVFRKQRISSAA